MLTDVLVAKPQRGFAFSVVVTVLCWIFVLAGAGTGMDVWAMSMLTLPQHQGGSMMAVEWTAGYALHMVVMWWVMMLAMMLPGVLLAIRLRWTSIQCTLEFLGIYAAVWLGFSVLATGLQYALQSASWFDAMRMLSVNNTLSICLLAGAVVPQALWLLNSLGRPPVASDERAPTASRYALRCLLSTGSMMLLMFIGGLMNLVWMVGLALWTAAQKSPRSATIAPAIAICLCVLLGVNIYLNSIS